MTLPSSGLASIRAVIAKWREHSRNPELIAVGYWIEKCADELEAALLAVDAQPIDRNLIALADDWLHYATAQAPGWGSQPAVPIALVKSLRDALSHSVVDAPPPQANILWEAFEAGHHAWPTPEAPTRRAAFERWFESARQSVAELPDWLKPAPPPQAAEKWLPCGVHGQVGCLRCWPTNSAVRSIAPPPQAEEPAVCRCPEEWERPASPFCKPHRCELDEGHAGKHRCDCGRTRTNREASDV